MVNIGGVRQSDSLKISMARQPTELQTSTFNSNDAVRKHQMERTASTGCLTRVLNMSFLPRGLMLDVLAQLEKVHLNTSIPVFEALKYEGAVLTVDSEVEGGALLHLHLVGS